MLKVGPRFDADGEGAGAVPDFVSEGQDVHAPKPKSPQELLAMQREVDSRLSSIEQNLRKNLESTTKRLEAEKDKCIQDRITKRKSYDQLDNPLGSPADDAKKCTQTDSWSQSLGKIYPRDLVMQSAEMTRIEDMVAEWREKYNLKLDVHDTGKGLEDLGGTTELTFTIVV